MATLFLFAVSYTFRRSSSRSRLAKNDAVFSLGSFARGGIVTVRVAVPRHGRDRVAQLRRQHVRVALAHQNQRLAPLLERSHVHDQRLDRRQRDLIPDLARPFRRILRVLLLERIARRVVELAPDELLHAAHHDRRMIARHPHGGDRLERVHQRRSCLTGRAASR